MIIEISNSHSISPFIHPKSIHLNDNSLWHSVWCQSDSQKFAVFLASTEFNLIQLFRPFCQACKCFNVSTFPWASTSRAIVHLSHTQTHTQSLLANWKFYTTLTHYLSSAYSHKRCSLPVCIITHLCAVALLGRPIIIIIILIIVMWCFPSSKSFWCLYSLNLVTAIIIITTKSSRSIRFTKY